MDQLPHRIVYLGSGIDDEACGKLMGGLLALNLASNDPVHLIINSPGGLALSLFSIYDIMRACSCPIWTFGVGSVMSAAVPLLAAGEKGERRISARSRVLIHAVSCGIPHTTLDFLRTYVDEVEEMQKTMNGIMLTETKLTKKDIAKLMDGKDHFFGAKEAVAMGIADKVVS